MKLGMPLKSGHIAFATHADGFDDAVASETASTYRIPPELLDRLVMNAVNKMFVMIPIQARQPGVFLNMNGMPVLVIQRRIHMWDGMGVFGDNILIKGSAQRHIDKLKPTAYTQHGFPLYDAFPEQLHFVKIPHPVARPFGPRWRLAVRNGADIRTPLQHEAIYFLDIVAYTHAGTFDATRLYGWQHEYQGATPHNPVGDALFKILQGFVAKT